MNIHHSHDPSRPVCALLAGQYEMRLAKSLVLAFTIGSSLVMTLCAASFFGLSVPSLLHKLKLDFKIAAGPVTLAITDISTLLVYFSLAQALL